MKVLLRKFSNRPYVVARLKNLRRLSPPRVDRAKTRISASSGGTPSPFSESLVRDALKEMESYCSSLPEDSQQALSCWEARDYFEKEALGAEQRCDREHMSGVKTGEGCDDFEDWESFVRQVELSGGVKNMLKTILVIKHAKEKAKEESKESSIVPATEVVEKTRIRRLCESLFEKMDKNHDGKIDVEEFRTIMKLLGDELHGDMVSVIFEALDIHGSLDFDQLITIIEAESVRSHSQDAGWLRLAQRHGHASDTPKWIENV